MKEMSNMKNSHTDILAHTTWKCKYHIVFAPEFRRKNVEILAAKSCLDHIHYVCKCTSQNEYIFFGGYLKGKSTLIIFEQYVNLKYKYGNSVF